MKAALVTATVVEKVRRSMGFEQLPDAIIDGTLVLTLNNKELFEIADVTHDGRILAITIRRRGKY